MYIIMEVVYLILLLRSGYKCFFGLYTKNGRPNEGSKYRLLGKGILDLSCFGRFYGLVSILAISPVLIPNVLKFGNQNKPQNRPGGWVTGSTAGKPELNRDVIVTYFKMILIILDFERISGGLKSSLNEQA